MYWFNKIKYLFYEYFDIEMNNNFYLSAIIPINPVLCKAVYKHPLDDLSKLF